MKLTEELLTMAIDGYTSRIEAINAKVEEIRRALSGEEAPACPIQEVKKKGKRKMTPAARKRISEAQRQRWVAYHAAKQTA